MALLARHRRYWIVIFLAALLLGMASELLGPFIGPRAGRRLLAPFPTIPAASADWMRLPDAIREYRRNFEEALGPLAQLDAILRYRLRSPLTARVAYGLDGWLFLGDEEALEQSLGELIRTEQVARLVAIAAAIERDLASEGGRLIVAIPPNASSVNRSHLPAWASGAPAMTEYDLLLAGLGRAGVVALDLRPPLVAAARTQAVYYRTDTHWNRLGMVIGYNAIMAALGRTDWQWDPARILRHGDPRTSGDTARLLGLEGLIEDPELVVDLGAASVPVDRIEIDREQFPSYRMETGRPGPVVAIIGDSFSRLFPDLLAPHVSRLVWTHHHFCRFDWNMVRSFHPAIVILMPNERQMPCPTEAWPTGLSER